MTWGELLSRGQEKLKDAGIIEYGLDAWYLFEAVFGMSRAQYFLHAADTADVSEEKQKEFETALSRRAGREPLQYITGVQEFMGMEFQVDPHVLIPRQDTETLVEAVLSENKDPELSILDMCTGSGCIAISLVRLGGYKKVEAADISREALKRAEKNAELLLPPEGVSSEPKQTLRFRESDMFSAFDPVTEKFDVIVSNPPYIPSRVIEGLEPEVKDFEPRNALDGTEDGLFFYRCLAESCGRFLRENGKVYFEIGHDQREAVSSLLKTHGFSDTRVIKDLTGKDRVVYGRYQAAYGPDQSVRKA